MKTNSFFHSANEIVCDKIYGSKAMLQKKKMYISYVFENSYLCCFAQNQTLHLQAKLTDCTSVQLFMTSVWYMLSDASVPVIQWSDWGTAPQKGLLSISRMIDE